MAISQINGVVQHLRGTLRDGLGVTDGQLLEEYISRRDEASFAALVRRHGPMVWGVCRRVLRNHHAAEDAFQATFLVFVRRAASIASRELLANWLYGVALQTALKARATAAKRGRRETQVANMPEPTVPEVRDADLLAALDEELSRLPDHYRGVVVLCDLEGMTRKQAARQLGIPEGSVASRLARARVMLARRLTHRGVALSGGALATVLSEQAASAGMPTSVVVSTIKAATLFAQFAQVQAAATGAISVKVASLTEGVLRTMLMSKLKAVVAVVLLLGFIGTGATVLTCRLATAQDELQPAPEEPVKDQPEPATKKEKEKVTAWGKEVNGVQIGIQLGENRVYKVGETVTLILLLRNNGKNEVPFSDDAEYFEKNPPLITDANNKAVTIKERSIFGFKRAKFVAPGKEVDLCKLRLDLRPDTDRKKDVEWTLYGTGKFHIKYEDIPVVGEVRLGSPGMTLATGKLELEVRESR